jgi:dipeptidyl aminopeptidase/acylaminoacyl peptidase
LQQIPQLDESLLALMGISSGAYVGLKTMENKPEDKAEEQPAV